jgi:ABC-type antimicrobial peptide transport system permease subunit
VMAKAEQKVVATTRKALVLPATQGILVTNLEREWQPDELDARAQQARRMAFRTIWITVISLLVTVIGIANAMLMSVTERFREIGTMKCLGALSSFIRQVFFIEASILGMAGSLAGCLLGYAFAVLAYMLTYGVDLVGAALSLPLLALHVLLCTAAGVVLSILAAIYPAGVASRMVPANALRSTV